MGHSVGHGSHADGIPWEYLGMVAHFSQTSNTLGSLAVRQRSQPTQRARSLFCKSHHRALEPFPHPVPCRTEPPADPPSPESETNPCYESWTPSRSAGSSGTAGLWFGRAEFVVINYPLLGEVPPILLFSCRALTSPCSFCPALPRKALTAKRFFLNQYFQKVTMLCTSHSPHSCPLRWGAGKFVGRDAQGGCGKQKAGISVPAKPGDLPEPCCPPRLLSCHRQGVPEAGDITAEEMTSREGSAARCQVMVQKHPGHSHANGGGRSGEREPGEI